MMDDDDLYVRKSLPETLDRHDQCTRLERDFNSDHVVTQLASMISRTSLISKSALNNPNLQII